ncbi:hypothetical protein NRZ30_13355 [Aeromonas jandaei]|uniref:hypothetical protein n=1 Tax=Aeromonas jandaei TaxID=650 RepID=UPI00227BB536|nr:hypothetical protein [Aeromonas jandaei]WAG06092.1 hypothetical protein NRZ30_13355 [Aeromonas jandaei]
MSLKLDDVLAFDDSLHDIFEKSCTRFMPVLKKSNFLETMQSLFGLMASINSIKLGVYDLAETCDTHLYVLKILYRSLLEQFLRFEFLFLRFIETGDEEIGSEYRKYSAISETIAYIEASQMAATMAGKSTDDIILKKLKKSHPDFDISKRSLKEITDKWKHRNIIRYLTSHFKKSTDAPEFLLKIIPDYANLSSFVHGGTSAEEYFHNIINDDLLKDEVVSTAINSCFIAAIVKNQLLVAITKIDPSFEEDRNRFTSRLFQFEMAVGSISEA